MMMGPSEMRLLAGRPPVIVMSATLNDEDCDDVKKCLGIRKNIVTIKQSPILSNIKFVTIERPSNQKGSGITEDDNGDVLVEDGLLEPIMNTFLARFCDDIDNNIEPKTAIIFSENTNDLIKVQNYLYLRLGDQGRNKPWVLITSDTGHVTKKRMRLRSQKGEIRLYLCTSVLIMGVDFARIDIVLICRPMPCLHSLVQAAGRGGRKLEDGNRRKVVVYQLFNQQDLVIGRKGLEKEVKEFCETFQCLRNYIEMYFTGKTSDIRIPTWCCGNCET